MSEEQTTQEVQENKSADTSLKLNGLYAFKIGMVTVFDESGTQVPVTALKYDPMYVSQVKTKEKDGYEAIQVAFKPKPARTANKAELTKFRKAGFENSAYHCKEILQSLPEGIQIGQKVSIDSLEKGALVKITAPSKGRGFSGAVKRHGFAGGPAAHGSKFHRKPGSMGMRTWPGRVLKGKKLPGQFGNEKTTIHNMTVVDILAEENVILVKGAVPGGANTLVRLVKEQ